MCVCAVCSWKHCPHRHPGEVAAQRRHPSLHKPAFCMNLKLVSEALQPAHLAWLTEEWHWCSQRLTTSCLPLPLIVPPLQYGSCAAGDDCPFSHNTFEMSLHPERCEWQPSSQCGADPAQARSRGPTEPACL